MAEKSRAGVSMVRVIFFGFRFQVQKLLNIIQNSKNNNLKKIIVKNTYFDNDFIYFGWVILYYYTPPITRKAIFNTKDTPIPISAA